MIQFNIFNEFPQKIPLIFKMILALSWVNAASTYVFFIYPKLPFLIFDLLCVFLPAFGYLDQIRQMFSSKSSSNFKMHSSIILIASNFLRVLYWFGKQFDGYLLWQSVFMLFIQMTLAFLYYRYMPNNSENYTVPDGLRGILRRKPTFRLRLVKAETFAEFTFSLFIYCTLATVSAFILSLIFDKEWIADIVGMMSNGIDCFVTLPQFMLIVIHRDIKYVTPLLVAQWLFAIVFKAVLYLCRPVPWPFRLGLAIQAMFTVFITISYFQIKIAEIRNQKKFIEENEKQIEIDTPVNSSASGDVAQ